ncbi:synaptophysin-like [Pollicipes pollicipes]|uniref:synaptophysin-like n=1 Tax=Pollicipes pollicipes TaxID=41117 RepID=UPI0018855AD3|nr:synaptophysin-like [Pollicipes pollicipes]XP_037086907.1 synaptophysin-like [Pollicipes pollicipes]XP_037086908.1 synaptophysin-like [Pollicipes pollicipes]
MLHVHVAVLKEPRGFIKILQFVLAILAFSTTVGFSTYFTFHATVAGCNSGSQNVVRKDVSYPFALDSQVVRQQLCADPPRTERFHFATDVSSHAKFFVAVGVICMLHAVLALAGYVLFSDHYVNQRIIPTVDFVTHALLAAMWLVAASAWASGLGALKSGADPGQQLNQLCDQLHNVDCRVAGDDHRGTFGKLNASLCFGFLNVFVWAGNLWFLFKETVWYKPRTSPSASATTTAAAPA